MEEKQIGELVSNDLISIITERFVGRDVLDAIKVALSKPVAIDNNYSFEKELNRYKKFSKSKDEEMFAQTMAFEKVFENINSKEQEATEKKLSNGDIKINENKKSIFENFIVPMNKTTFENPKLLTDDEINEIRKESLLNNKNDTEYPDDLCCIFM